MVNGGRTLNKSQVGVGGLVGWWRGGGGVHVRFGLVHRMDALTPWGDPQIKGAEMAAS